MHIDDSPMLYKIRDNLGFGKVYEYKENNISTFSIAKREDIKKLIAIFDSYPLQSTKLLNLLAFKKAFYIYNNSPNRTLSQSDLDLALLEAIRDFLINIPEAKLSGLTFLDNIVHINVSKKRQDHYKNEATLSVTQWGFIKCVLIPLFDSMS